MWIISAWCMYREIKALDYETPVDQGQSDAFCPNQNPSSLYVGEMVVLGRSRH